MTAWLPRAGVHADVAVLNRRTVYILPTRNGTLFGAVLLVMLLGSINYDVSLGYVLTFLLASIGLVGMLHTYRNLAGLGVGPARAAPVFAGSSAEFELRLDNLAGPARYAVEVRRALPRAWLSRWRKRAADELRPDGRVELAAGVTGSARIEVPARQRGRVRIGRVRIETRYPLGLFRAWSYVTLDAEALVYPRPAGVQRLPEPPGSIGSGSSGSAHGTDDFLGFRDYAAGDSPRYIAWKALARRDTLLVKRFTGAQPAELWLRLEDAPGPDLEARLAQLARWILVAETAGRAYGLVLPGATIGPGTGEPHSRRCLVALALCEPLPAVPEE